MFWLPLSLFLRLYVGVSIFLSGYLSPNWMSCLYLLTLSSFFCIFTAREGYVFTPVCLSMGGGWCLGPGPGGGIGGLARGVSRPRPRREVGGSGQWGVQAHAWGGVCPGPHPEGVCPGPCLGWGRADQAQDQGLCPSMYWGRHPPPPPQADCYRWYASYWNTFLLGIVLIVHLLKPRSTDFFRCWSGGATPWSQVLSPKNLVFLGPIYIFYIFCLAFAQHIISLIFHYFS